MAPTFFVHAKFEVKNFSEFFPLPSTLDSEFFIERRVGSGYQLFLVMSNLKPKIFWNFFLYRVFWTEFFEDRGFCTNIFGHCKFQVKNFLEFFPLLSTLALNLSGGLSGHLYFWSYQI